MKKSLFSLLQVCALAALFLASCNSSDDIPNAKDEEPAKYSIRLSAPQQKVLKQSNDFAFDALKAVNNESENVFISPYSLGQALAMLANGAEDETFDEIANVLKIGDGTSLDDINSFYTTMNKALTDIQCSSEIAYANSLWTNKIFSDSINESYIKNMVSIFNAHVEALDFDDAKSVDIINSWAKKQTNGLIPNIVSKLYSFEQVAILLNSLYFKGLWNYFPKKNTYDDKFRNQFDRNENVKMMKSDECTLNGFITDEELMVEFDYGGKAFQMQVIMPKKTDINTYIQNLNGEKYATMLSYMMSSTSEVAFPKFKNTYSNDFNKPLQRMGITRAFEPDASLRKIANLKGLYIDKVMQNASIEVNEEGSVASATTRVDGDLIISPGHLPKQFIIDHPFIYLIRERQTGAILFIGKVQSMEGMQN